MATQIAVTIGEGPQHYATADAMREVSTTLHVRFTPKVGVHPAAFIDRPVVAHNAQSQIDV